MTKHYYPEVCPCCFYDYFTSYEKEVSGKVRKYYQLTGEGRKFLEKKREEWEQYTKAVTSVLAFGM